ncbi:TetR family transcriptional regulator [Alicyclobacillus sp. SO9]|uniref:TetR family transcriptional regulator n=1 Tax=Alicyclobacillus sp. SO9 TaxID=2665646 RepID=UPI0018E89660|nr:TetR family transcriptional regulator [Alicyclobacillus sp. SO9]QQE77111.1 helix-turn-helix transcriptional regulator [Alicyclobacillus sp. SO9]
MARPLSDDKRNAIISAAIRVISSQGLSASTALIAKEAVVSNGALFTYFETKADLFNRLSIELKENQSAMSSIPMMVPS